MKKAFLLSVFIALCFFMGTTTSAFGGIAPSPFVPIRSDLTLFQQKIDVAHGKLAKAKPGADLAATTLMGSHEDMMNLLRSLQAKVKSLQTEGQEKGIIIIYRKMKPKLDSLEVSLKNCKTAIQKNNGPAARSILNEMGATVKGLAALAAD